MSHAHFVVIKAGQAGPAVTPLLTTSGLAHVDGLSRTRGPHVVAARWQPRRSSSFLDGIRRDAATMAGRRPDRIGAGVLGRAA
jgi:hypothetical protein